MCPNVRASACGTVAGPPPCYCPIAAPCDAGLRDDAAACNCPNVGGMCGFVTGPPPCYCPTAVVCDLAAAPIDLPAPASTDLAAPACGACGACLGPCCGSSCCGAGERCDNGVCRCGNNPACGAGQQCAAGGPIQPGVTCGFICCGNGVPCPL
jgi:hypothetical protein